MSRLRVTIRAPFDLGEAVLAFLLELCPDGVVQGTAEGAAVHTCFLPAEAWDSDKVKETVDRWVAGLCDAGLADASQIAVDIAAVSDADWVEEVRRQFKTVRVGRIVVIPSWEKAAAAAAADDIPIHLDPGLAFGTGAHPTTRSCLLALQDLVGDGDRVIDVGTGSAVLAIAAVRLGAGRVTALDIDETAVGVAVANVEGNGVADKVDVRLGRLRDLPRAEAQIVVANLTAETVLPLMKSFGGIRGLRWVVVSGIMAAQGGRIEAGAEESGLMVDRVLRDEGWDTFVLAPLGGEGPA